jgi:cyclophilin family peptidyl-prolyl cis-trans isomerase
MPRLLVQGLLSMANMGPDTNGNHFSILMAPAPHLNNHYTVFGEVVSGFEVSGRCALAVLWFLFQVRMHSACCAVLYQVEMHSACGAVLVSSGDALWLWFSQSHGFWPVKRH